MIRLSIEAAVEDEHLEEFLTLLVKFDRSHPNGLMRMLSLGGDMSMDDIKALFARLNLPIVFAERKQ